MAVSRHSKLPESSSVTPASSMPSTPLAEQNNDPVLIYASDYIINLLNFDYFFSISKFHSFFKFSSGIRKKNPGQNVSAASSVASSVAGTPEIEARDFRQGWLI